MSRILTVDFIERGEFIIALDSQDRENEGDLIIAAESITDAQMAFLVRFTRLALCPVYEKRYRKRHILTLRSK